MFAEVADTWMSAVFITRYAISILRFSCNTFADIGVNLFLNNTLQIFLAKFVSMWRQMVVLPKEVDWVTRMIHLSPI